ncbi:MAG: binding-protein-dependent transport system inner rane component [Microbacteriaceae bacterium]|jgi:ABC-type nitrate/sulfonate/bicarbonate transport system permease component|nr:binding-protein-dependent transport system inner rane component [Microbacteriaceae bacterium]HEV7957079.1 ABC transporter permease [Marisediminicola sp.]
MTATDTSWGGVAQRPRRDFRRLREFAARWGALFALGVVWEIAARIADSIYFPPISRIMHRFVELWLSGPPNTLFLTEGVATDIVPSLTRMLGGWSIAVVLGVLLGVAIGRSRTLGDFVEPIIHFVRAIPPPALIPIFFILLGIGNEMRVSLIAFAVIWPVLLNTIDGVRSVETLHLDTGRVFEFDRRKVFFGIVLPSAAPKIFAGMRVSLSVALIVMVISEMVGRPDGIGSVILGAQRTFRMLDMWSGILLLGILGYVLNALLALVESRVTKWHRGAREGVS